MINVCMGPSESHIMPLDIISSIVTYIINLLSHPDVTLDEMFMVRICSYNPTRCFLQSSIQLIIPDYAHISNLE